MSGSYWGTRPPVAAAWLAAVQRRGKHGSGEPLGNLHNGLLALSQDPDFSGMFGFDEMLQTVVMHHAGALDFAYTTNDFPRPLTDLDVIAVTHLLQAKGLRIISTDCVRQAVERIGSLKPFH